jgi:hypothetical protein
VKKVFLLLVFLLVASSAPATATDYPEQVDYARAFVRELVNVGQWACLDKLWDAESGWSVHARTGKAYGIPQARPGYKMASAEHPRWGFRWNDWKEDAFVQVWWGLNYIRNRYGTPCHAWRHFKLHLYY